MTETQKALLVIDFEREWADPSSDYYAGDISGAIDRTNRLIDFCRGKGCKIIFTRHVEKDSEDAFTQESEGSKLIKRLHKEEADTLITKYKISPFFQTCLEKELVGVKEVVVAGILTNLCVRQTVEEAYDRDFRITVIKDCCIALDEDIQEFTFRDLKATREEVEFLYLKDFLKAME